MEMHMCPPHKLVAMIFDCQRTEMAGSRASRHLNSRTSRPEPRAPLFGRPPSHGTLCVPDSWEAVNYFYRIIFPENIDRRAAATRDHSCATVGWTFCWPFRLRKCFYSSGPAPCQPFFLEFFSLKLSRTLYDANTLKNRRFPTCNRRSRSNTTRASRSVITSPSTRTAP